MLYLVVAFLQNVKILMEEKGKIMKKIVSLLLVLVLAIGTMGIFAACSSTYEIALITDVGNIDDKSFNEGAWNGVKEYAEANGVSYAYYRPIEDSTEARMNTIKTAINKGAKMIVCPGYMFQDAIYNLQDEYPDIDFLFLDGEPNDNDYSNGMPNYKTSANVHCILYKEDQAGYLAGYAAVMDGYRKLGFMGGMDVPAVVRFGHGYVQGAEDAAEELGLEPGDIEIKYTYVGTFGPSDDIKTKAGGWYTSGTEVIFSCGGGIYLSITAAAAEAGKDVIGVDVDQFAATGNTTFITSAMKGLTVTTVQALTAYYDNDQEWPEEYAGETDTLGVVEDAVGLPTDAASWRFATYTVEEYTTLYNAMVAGTVVVNVSSTGGEIPATTIVNVIED